eukprot:TRINITY_DN5996_c0_g1_i1.p1 TRINITY_DN5996_c0_g1~~TRINITY_DN5996_c0_g1_i1.p1  ORF type:complete len:1159 (-),score=231.26 TRINITY_DN5996_c0_g1_i1:59-3463(-)
MVMVPRDASEQKIDDLISTEFRCELRVCKYLDHESDKVSVKPSQWVKEVVAVYDHLEAKAGPSEIVALKVFLERQAHGRLRSDSDPPRHHFRPSFPFFGGSRSASLTQSSPTTPATKSPSQSPTSPTSPSPSPSPPPLPPSPSPPSPPAALGSETAKPPCSTLSLVASSLRIGGTVCNVSGEPLPATSSPLAVPVSSKAENSCWAGSHMWTPIPDSLKEPDFPHPPSPAHPCMCDPDDCNCSYGSNSGNVLPVPFTPPEKSNKTPSAMFTPPAVAMIDLDGSDDSTTTSSSGEELVVEGPPFCGPPPFVSSSYMRTPPRMDPFQCPSPASDAKTPPTSPRRRASDVGGLDDDPMNLPPPEKRNYRKRDRIKRPEVQFPLEQSHQLAIPVKFDCKNLQNLQLHKCTTTPKHWVKSPQRIGKGGFGTVYIGMDQDSGEIFAVKQIELDASNDERAQRLLQSYDQEIQLMKSLNHPNIVKYLGASVEGLTLNIFMEYVGGGSLSSIYSKFGPFSENMVRSYTKQLLCGLKYLHSFNILHRDIKCANVLLDTTVGGRANVKLTDFGCSRKIADTLAQVQPNSVRGTPFWMAPEVILAKGHGTAADIWSLACTVVEMVTGKPPWSQQFPDPNQAMYNICQTTTPLHIPSHLSPQLQHFLDICLQRDPSNRPDAEHLLQHAFIKMDRVRNPLTLSNLECSPLSPIPAQTFSPTQPQILQVTPQFVLETLPPAVIANILLYLDTLDLARLQLVCQVWRKILLDDNVWQMVCLDYWNTVLVKGKTWKNMFISYYCDQRAWETKDIVPYVFKGHDKAINTIRCISSDNNTRIFSGSRDKKIKIWDLKKTKSVHTLKGHTGSVRCLDFVPLDKSYSGSTVSSYHLLSGSDDKTMRIWNLKSKKCVGLMTQECPITAVSVDGSRFVSASSTSLVLWDLQTCTPICCVGRGHTQSTVDTAAALSVSFRCDLIAAGYEDGVVRLWDARAPPYFTASQLDGHRGPVTALQLSALDNLLVSGSRDGTVRRWDVKHMACTKVFQAMCPVLGLAVDDLKVISCGEDKMVRLWDCHTARCLRVLEGHTNSVLSVHSDQTGIYSGGRDKLLRVWFLSSSATPRVAHRRSFVPGFLNKSSSSPSPSPDSGKVTV